MHADPALTRGDPPPPWLIHSVGAHRGGRVLVPRHRAPLGRMLPYRRAAGESPAPTGAAETLARTGWSVQLGDRQLGDTLLALGLAHALIQSVGGTGELHYQGPRPRLFARCVLPLATAQADGPHRLGTAQHGGREFVAVPEEHPAWLDQVDGDLVEVHAALPMRYYLAAEQALGARLPATHAPLPAFLGHENARPFHVVFVTATSWAVRKDYGIHRFARLAQALAERVPSVTFTLITGSATDPGPQSDWQTLPGPDAIDCLDVFASAELVIGNDTGLTHLAALTRRPDGTMPHVIGLYGRHAHTKWTTGSDHHHAIATPFSQLLALADRCPVRDRIDDALWGPSSDLTALPAAAIAEFAGQITGWGRRRTC